MSRASFFTGVGARSRLVYGLAWGLASVWGLGLAPSSARAEGACEGKERVAQEYSLSAGDLRKALGMPEGVAGFGRSGCIFWAEGDLDEFRAATVKEMHSRVQAAFGDRFRAEKGLSAGEEISCRVEFGGLPEVTSTFDRPQEGESPLGNYLMATPCSGKTKRNHYAQATVDWEGLTPRVVCENIWLVGAGCGRAPSTLGPAVVVDRSPAILKRPVAEDERPAGSRGGPGRALDVK